MRLFAALSIMLGTASIVVGVNATAAYAWTGTVTTDQPVCVVPLNGSWNVDYTVNNPERQKATIVDSSIASLVGTKVGKNDSSQPVSVTYPASQTNASEWVKLSWPSDKGPHKFTSSVVSQPQGGCTPTVQTNYGATATISCPSGKVTVDASASDAYPGYPLNEYVLVNGKVVASDTANLVGQDGKWSASASFVPASGVTSAVVKLTGPVNMSPVKYKTTVSWKACTPPPQPSGSITGAGVCSSWTPDGYNQVHWTGTVTGLKPNTKYSFEADLPQPYRGSMSFYVTSDANGKLVIDNTGTNRFGDAFFPGASVKITIGNNTSGQVFSTTYAMTKNPACTPPPVDVCSNIAGVQTTVPTGYTVSNGVCTKKPVPPKDVCSNLSGVQTSVPSGYTESNGVCTKVVTHTSTAPTHHESTTPVHNTSTPAPTPSSSAYTPGSGGTGDGMLANTGSSINLWLEIGFGLLAIGLLMFLPGVRRWYGARQH